MKAKVKPGAKVPDSGIYQNDSGQKATLVKNKIAPPTLKKGDIWKQKVDTNPRN